MKIEKPRAKTEQTGISRRKFICSSAFLGGSALLATQLDWALGVVNKAQAGNLSLTDQYELSKAENVIYSVCLQCHTSCPIKAKVLNGVLAKIDGPAYSPQAMLPNIKYETSTSKAALIDGKVCPKGQAGIQSLYDPYRIVKVLKRSGPRGSNKWQAISFNQAIDEIVNGGKLFKHVKGEENRHVTGLKDIHAVKDAKLMASLKSDAAAVASKKMTAAQFRKKHAGHLHLLIDPDHPDLGPVNNQFVLMAGRIEHGRKELGKRWLGESFGSVNFYEHTTICEQSHHIAYLYATNKFANGKWTGGKHHMKPDALNSRFIIFFGTGAFEANFGPPPMAEKITEGISSGRLKIAVVDPRFSKTAAKANQWLPISPGSDAALALAMIRWIIENKKFDKNFLSSANKASAAAKGEPSWSTASWLVKIDDKGTPGKYLRASELGLGDENSFVVLSNGHPQAVNPYDKKSAIDGDLLVNTTLKGLKVKSALQLLWESASSKSLAEWAGVCGLSTEAITSLAKEFTSYGKQAVAEFYRGPVQHTNGYYNAQALICLNLLIGNPDWKGGLTVGGGHWHEYGGKPGNPYDMAKLHPGKIGSFGIKLTREKSKYESTTLFKGYPAKRPFYPFTSNLYQEILPSAGAAYPYPVKALLLHMGTPGLSTPAAQTQLDILADVDKLPLLLASDIVIGESSMYADYIFPDLSVWERWGTPHTTPDVQVGASKIRQPIVAPLTESVKVYGNEIPLSFEALLLGLAEKLNLSGHGKGGFGADGDFTRPEDYYLKLAANIAMGDKENDAVPEADFNELKLFARARRHLPKTVFDPKRWQKAVNPEHWKRLVYVLNRGGRYENFEKAYETKYVKHKFGGLFSFYAEPIGTTLHSISGKPFSGVAIYEPVKDAAGKTVSQKGFDFQLITYKEIMGGQSRTLPTDYWLASLLEENSVLMNSKDADRLGLSDGSMVQIMSSTNPKGIWDLKNGSTIPVAGKVKVIEGIRPGTVAVSWHFGHWAYGANDVEVDGQIIKGDKRRRKGLCTNAVLLTDPYLKDVCMTDPIGGSSSFYDTNVKIVSVS